MSPKRQILLLSGLFLAVYAVCRQKTVGHCDEWAYFAQSELLLGRDPGLHRFHDALRHPALTPLGMDVARGHYVSAFPPGYSLLLALAGMFGAQFFVCPLLGAISVLLVYLAVGTEVHRPIALGVAAVWGLCPLVGMNATDVMSDMLATDMVLGSYLLLQSTRFGAAGAMLGLSLVVRPMNLLFLPAAVLMIPRDRRTRIAFLRTLAAGAAVSLLLDWLVWGRALSPSYENNAGRFFFQYFVRQFPAYLWQTIQHIGPILPLAAFGVAREPRRSLPLLVWIAAFFLVYPAAGPLEIDWPRPRFLLPSYPALFVLAARGATGLVGALPRKARLARLVSLVLLGGTVIGWGAWSARRSFRLGALQVHPSRDPDCQKLEELLPKNALVGALEYSGSVRLYNGRETFLWVQADAVRFARQEYLSGRPVYLLLEPDEMLAPWDQRLARRFRVAFELVDEAVLNPHGYVLQRIDGVRAPGYAHVLLGEPSGQWALIDGWLGPDKHWASDYKAVGCERARIGLPFKKRTPHELRLYAAAKEGGAPAEMQVAIDGRVIGGTVLGPDFRTVSFVLEPGAGDEAGLVELRLPGAPPCDGRESSPYARFHMIDLRSLSD